MQFREWFQAQSSAVKVLVVVGVVAVAFVVLAVAVAGTAILGTFAMDSGDDVQPSQPEASFNAAQSEDEVDVTHGGGDALAADRLVVAVGDERTPWHELDDSMSADGTVRADDSVTVTGVESGDTVRVLWLPQDGGDPVTMIRYQAM